MSEKVEINIIENQNATKNRFEIYIKTVDVCLMINSQYLPRITKSTKPITTEVELKEVKK
jgi:hypothetical protein